MSKRQKGRNRAKKDSWGLGYGNPKQPNLNANPPFST